jgi:hypothetical protein
MPHTVKFGHHVVWTLTQALNLRYEKVETFTLPAYCSDL